MAKTKFAKEVVLVYLNESCSTLAENWRAQEERRRTELNVEARTRQAEPDKRAHSDS